MGFHRRTYAPEVADAVVERVKDRFEAEWGLKMCQVGGLEWLFLPKDLTLHLPMVLVEVQDVRQEGEPKLQSRLYTYEVRARLFIKVEDAQQNPRLLLVRLRDLHDEFIKEDYDLSVTVDDPDAWGFLDCQAKGYSPLPNALELFGIFAGEVRIIVRASADPYTP